MLALHDRLLEVEAQPAIEADLLRVHTPSYLDQVRRAVHRAEQTATPVALTAGVMVSGASWTAALAAAGCAITGAARVLAGEASNAFCATRPPGAGAGPDHGGGFAIFNNLAVTARWLSAEHGIRRILIVYWGGPEPHGLLEALGVDPELRLVSLGDSTEPGVATSPLHRGLAAGADGTDFRAAQAEALAVALIGWAPEFVLLGAGLDALAADPFGTLALAPLDYYGLTADLVAVADRTCGGRLVSVLEGGFAAHPLAGAVVQHLRALAGLEPAAG